MKKYALPLILGGLAGAGVGYVGYRVAARKLESRFAQGREQMLAQLGVGAEDLATQLEVGRDRLVTQVRREVRREVPRRVKGAVEETFDSYGITRSRLAKTFYVIDWAEERGLL